MRQWIHLSNEAQYAAAWQAKKGYDGSDGTPLPMCMDARVVEEINEHKTLFRLAVHMAKITLINTAEGANDASL